MPDINPNAAQQQFWNNVGGPRWISLGGFVERRTAPVNPLLLAHAAVRPGERVLEIGCGTGAATVPLAQAVGPAGEVVGIDISEPMLEHARHNIAERRLANVSFLLADAQTHRFAPGHFDLLVSRFGVMFFADPAAAFANLIGALRPGGRLCFVCWTPLADNPHWLVPFEVARRHLGAPAPRPPREPGPLAFSDPDYVRDFLGAAGFADIAIERASVAIAGSSPAEEAEHAMIMGPPGRLIEEKQPDDALRARIRQDIEEAFAARARAGKVELPATVFFVTARRPA
jgi:SAM-dependent methyltransferase